MDLWHASLGKHKQNMKTNQKTKPNNLIYQESESKIIFSLTTPQFFPSKGISEAEWWGLLLALVTCPESFLKSMIFSSVT